MERERDWREKRGGMEGGRDRGRIQERGLIRTLSSAPLTMLLEQPPQSGPYAPELRSWHRWEGLGRSQQAAQSRRLPARGGGREAD